LLSERLPGLNIYVCFITGKDIIIFVAPEDHKTPSNVTLSDNDDSEPGTLYNLYV